MRFASSLFIDPTRHEARWRGRQLDLSGRPFELLLTLARQPGRIVERRELIDRVWGEVAVSDASLTQAVSTVRKALGDDAAARALIVTVAGRGYQLADQPVVDVGRAQVADDTLADTDSVGRLSFFRYRAIGRGRRRSPRRLVLSLLAMALVACCGWWVWQHSSGEPAASGATGDAVSQSPIQDGSAKGHATTRSPETEAERALMTGHAALERRTLESLLEAFEAFELALSIDDGLASAEAGLAAVWLLRAVYDASVRPLDAYAQVRVHADRALELDPNSASAHAVVGLARFNSDYDWLGARESLNRALELEPDMPRLHHWLAWVEWMCGRTAAAEASMARARSLDRVSPIIATASGTLRLYGGDATAALQWQRTVVEQFPRFARARHNLGVALEQLGDISAARRELRSAREHEPDSAEFIAALAHLELKHGNTSLGGRLLAEIEARAAVSVDHGTYGYPLAIAYSGQGELDAAHGALSEALASRGVFPPHALSDPRLARLRSRPETGALLDRFFSS